MTGNRYGIGDTPLVPLHGTPGGTVFVKLEQYNPGGSIKDRIALAMIERAEARGVLRPGMAIVESSSGNTAIGLAMIGAKKGYAVYAICDRNVPAAKLARIAALGGHIVYLPATPEGFDTVDLRIALADRLAADIPHAMTTAQFANPDNPHAHEHGTAPEIWDQTGGTVTQVVAAVGTCGTVTGVARGLKARNPAIRVHAVEPVGSIIFGGTRGNFLIQGGGLAFTPTILDASMVDGHSHVTDQQAITAVHRFAREHGVLVGGTAGWVLHRLYEMAETTRAGDVIVGILPDGGDRYLDTIYDPAWLAAHDFRVPRDAADTAIARASAAFDCSVDIVGSDEGDIAGLYRALGLAVPALLTPKYASLLPSS